MAMPERIWAHESRTRGRQWKPSIERDCYGDAEYVLASTHQRTLEALRGALEDVREAIVRADPNVLTCTLWMHNSPAETVVDHIDAALARIKETTDGR